MMPFDFHAEPEAKPGGRSIMLPPKLATKAELFAFFSKAIPLPKYFGHNWDALWDCFSDLFELPDEKIVLIHQDIPMENHPADQSTYLSILVDAVNEPNGLRVVFPESCRLEIERLLATGG